MLCRAATGDLKGVMAVALHTQQGALSCAAQVICWVLGEYGVLAPGGARVVMERLVDLAEGQSLPEEVPL